MTVQPSPKKIAALIICPLVGFGWGWLYRWFLHKPRIGRKLYEDNISLATAIGVEVDMLIALPLVLVGLIPLIAWIGIQAILGLSWVGPLSWHIRNGKKPIAQPRAKPFGDLTLRR